MKNIEEQERINAVREWEAHYKNSRWRVREYLMKALSRENRSLFYSYVSGTEHICQLESEKAIKLFEATISLVNKYSSVNVRKGTPSKLDAAKVMLLRHVLYQIRGHSGRNVERRIRRALDSNRITPEIGTLLGPTLLFELLSKKEIARKRTVYRTHGRQHGKQ